MGTKITEQEAINTLCITSQTLYRWHKKGLLSKFKVGKRNFYNLDEVTNLSKGIPVVPEINKAS